MNTPAAAERSGTVLDIMMDRSPKFSRFRALSQPRREGSVRRITPRARLAVPAMHRSAAWRNSVAARHETRRLPNHLALS